MNFNENRERREELVYLRAYGEGTWRVMGYRLTWYVVNVHTGIGKKIGPVRMKGTNFCDKARVEAQHRNEKEQEQKGAQ